MASDIILVVDDDLNALEMLSEILQIRGYEVCTAQNGFRALEVAQTQHPALILLDIMMPDLDGYEVCERLKANPDTRPIPVIFVSALDGTLDKVKGLRGGSIDYIAKPYDAKEVLARLEIHLTLHALQQQLEQQIEERDALIAKLDVVNGDLQQEVAERHRAEREWDNAMQRLQAMLARTDALYQIARALIVYENLPDVLQTVADCIVKALSADRVALITVDLEAQAVTRFVKGGPGVAQLPDLSFAALLEGLHGWVLERVQPVLSTKERLDPRESPNAQRRRVATNAGSRVVVPLYYRGRMRGTIAVINRPEQQNFTPEDVALLNAIASQVVITLETSRLAAETSSLKRFNESIVQGVAEAILLMDAEGRITFVNPAAEQLLGYDSTALMGRTYSDIVSPEEHDRFTVEFAACHDQTYQGRCELNVLSQSGEVIPVIAGTCPLFAAGEFVGVLVAFTDITERKRTEEQLRRYTADLEAQNAELDAFAHTVAHDLKIPLTAMRGFGTLLSERFEEISSQQRNYFLDFIIQNSRRMTNIVDALLLLAKVREVEAVEITPLDMTLLVEEACERLTLLIAQYQAEMVFPEQWPVAYGYGPWVQEVWTNYLSNALKYGGSPLVVTVGAMEKDGSGRVRFWVRDNGLGISREAQAHLFIPFERLHTVKAEGHGLGLSIVRRIVERLGGCVGVESDLGAGSTFWFTLPQQPPGAAG